MFGFRLLFTFNVKSNSVRSHLCLIILQCGHMMVMCCSVYLQIHESPRLLRFTQIGKFITSSQYSLQSFLHEKANNSYCSRMTREKRSSAEKLLCLENVICLLLESSSFEACAGLCTSNCSSETNTKSITGPKPEGVGS